MGQSFELTARNGKTESTQVKASQSFTDELFGSPIKLITDLDHKVEGAVTGAVSSAAKSSALARYGLVTVEGLGYTIPGIWHGITHDLSHPGELATKALTAFTIGVGMRLLFPEGGAAKALAGTVMGGFFLWDAAKPIIAAYKEAENASDLSGVNQAAQKMGDGLGLFAVDSFIGMKAGGLGERATVGGLKAWQGQDGYLAFEKSKADFWNSDKHIWGRSLNGVARTLDTRFRKAADKVSPQETRPTLSKAEIQQRIQEAGHHGQYNIEDSVFYKAGGKNAEVAGERGSAPAAQGGFYRHGDTGPDGRRIGFAQTINALMGDKAAEADGIRPATTVGVGPRTASQSLASDVVPQANEFKAPGSTGTTRVTTSPAQSQVSAEMDPQVFAKMAKEAQARQEAWSDEQIQIADLRDGVKGPLQSVIDDTRRGALYGPEYKLPNSQLMAIADQMQTAQDVQEAGQLLGLHAGAALQAEQRIPLTLSLNDLAADFNSMLLEGIRKAGIKDAYLEGKTVSKTIITGRDNYTMPHIADVVDGAVTAFPRSQVELRGVFGPIQAHENFGHDNIFPTLARFPENIRTQIIEKAVTTAMTKANIADTVVDVPGVGQLKTSELIKNILIAQANENTSDIGGTAVTGMGTPDSLTTLLMSLREGGLLETRSVYGSQYPNVFEVHGIDAWRLKLTAEVLRQRSNGDAALNKLAGELDQLSGAVSRPGSNYVWASRDQKGQFFTIPRSTLDAVIPHLVDAQLNTPLDSLKGHTLAEILPDLPTIWKKTSFLSDQMLESAMKGQDVLQAPFNKNDYRISQVFTAGLLAWKRATAKGGDVAETLNHINSIFDGLAREYQSGNPHLVPVTRNPISRLTSQPLRALGDYTAQALRLQPAARSLSARWATPVASAWGSTLTQELFQKYARQNNIGQ